MNFVEQMKANKLLRKELKQRERDKERLEEKRKLYNSTHLQNKRFRKQKKRTAMAKGSRRINKK